MILWAAAIAVSAVPVVALGYVGSDWPYEYWVQDEGVVIRTADDSISGLLTIPSQIEGLPVVKIDDSAFNDHDSITALSIPSTVREIDTRAFYRCDGLTQVDIPEGVMAVGKESFWQCNNVTAVNLPASLTRIGEYAFGNCSRLASFNVDTNNTAYTDVNGVLFSKDLTALIDYPKRWANSQSYVIPPGTRSINDKAFNNVALLRDITIPDSITHIGEYAFVSCYNWTDADLPDALIAIGDAAFMNCNRLPAIFVPAATEYIGDRAFESCRQMMSIDVSPSNAVYSSHDGILYNKDRTRLICCPAGWSGSYTPPSTVKHIGSRAFDNCGGVSEVILSDSVETLGDYAFYNCINLSQVTLSPSVTTLGNQMFRGCSNLESIEVAPSNAVFSDIDGVLFNKEGTVLLAYPPGRGGSYSVPPGVEVIYEHAFADCDGLTDITIPAGVTYLARNVFWGCYNLTGVTLPGSIDSIGRDVFDWCPNLQSFSVSSAGSKFSSIDGVLFNADGTGLIRYPEGRFGRYAVPAGTKTIDWHAFYGCLNLTSVSFPGSMDVVGNSAFYLCYGLRSAIFLGDAPVLGGNAFYSPAYDFNIYYLDGAFGFVSPEWNGYPTDLLMNPHLTWEPGGWISWFAQRGIEYSSESTTNLVSSEWIAAPYLISGYGSTNFVHPAFVAESEMYRVNIDLP